MARLATTGGSATGLSATDAWWEPRPVMKAVVGFATRICAVI
jgi:hypothetical protein